MRPVPAVARRQFGAFTVAQALADGWTPSSLETALKRGLLIRLRRGVFILADEVGGDDIRARRRLLAALSSAVVLATPRAVASNRSSAVLAGLPVLTLPAQPCITVAPGENGVRRDIHVHRASLDLAAETVRAQAIRRTSSARTVVDVARECGVDEAIVIADAALHDSMTSAAAIQQCIDVSRGWPGRRHAVEALLRCDGLAESPLESISRLRLIDLGLPVPRLQARIVVNGWEIARTDFLWEEFGVCGEADGLDKYDGSRPSALREEKQRQERLERAGLIVVRWGWRDVATPRAAQELASRIRWAFGEGASRVQGCRRWHVV